MTDPVDAGSQPVIPDTRPWKHRTTDRVWDLIDRLLAWVTYRQWRR